MSFISRNSFMTATLMKKISSNEYFSSTLLVRDFIFLCDSCNLLLRVLRCLSASETSRHHHDCALQSIFEFISCSQINSRIMSISSRSAFKKRYIILLFSLKLFTTLIRSVYSSYVRNEMLSRVLYSDLILKLELRWSLLILTWDKKLIVILESIIAL
jgi:hypothetical protein